MKKYKNLLWFGAIGLGLYYFLKKDKKSTLSINKFPFTKEDLMRTDRTITLTEVGGNAVLEYKTRYRGGVAPDPITQATSGKWKVTGNVPNLKTNNPISLMGDTLKVASTKDVVDFIFSSDKKWNVKFGQPISNSGVMFPRANTPAKIPTMGMNDTYGVPSGISLKR